MENGDIFNEGSTVLVRMADYLKTESGPYRVQLNDLFRRFPAVAQVTALTIRPGGFLIRQSAPCDAVYVLVEGTITVISVESECNNYAFWKFHAIELFGEYEVLAGHDSYLAEVRADTVCRLIAVPAEVYLRWMLSDTDVFMLRVRSVMRTLIAQSAQGRSTLFLDGRARTIRFLVRYYRGIHNGCHDPDDSEVTVLMTRQAISEELGVSVRTVNRSLKSLEECGLVDIPGGKVRITASQARRLQAELDNRF